MKHSILFGNGFNRLLEDFPKWSDIVSDGRDISNKDIPYTLQFENLLVSRMEDDILEKEDSLKQDIKRKLSDCSTRLVKGISVDDVYDIIAKLPVNNYMTTNYDSILKLYLESIGYGLTSHNYDEDLYSIRRFYGLVKKDSKKIWNIHGDAEKYKSMVIGYNHYCGLIWKMNSYLKGTYSYTNKSSRTKQNVGKIVSRIIEKQVDYDCQELVSWIDLFFTSNVHIIGLGLSFDEIDIWWLLCYRARLMNTSIYKRLINNKIYYYGWEIDPYKKETLTSFGVDVITTSEDEIERDVNNNVINTRELYKGFLSSIKSIIESD